MNLETEERIRSAIEAGSIAIFGPSGLSPMGPLIPLSFMRS